LGFIPKSYTLPRSLFPFEKLQFSTWTRFKGTPKNKLPNFVGWASCPSLMISGQDARTTRNFWGFYFLEVPNTELGKQLFMIFPKMLMYDI
jgi:hypothetical protein